MSNAPVAVVGSAAQMGGQATELNAYVGGSGGLNGGSGGGATPVGAVAAGNPLTGVKRPALNNPVSVPNQLPGFRGRVIDSDGPIKVPKLRNGNLNNETSNVRRCRSNPPRSLVVACADRVLRVRRCASRTTA